MGFRPLPRPGFGIIPPHLQPLLVGKGLQEPDWKITLAPRRTAELLGLLHPSASRGSAVDAGSDSPRCGFPSTSVPWETLKNLQTPPEKWTKGTKNGQRPPQKVMRSGVFLAVFPPLKNFPTHPRPPFFTLKGTAHIIIHHLRLHVANIGQFISKSPFLWLY